MKRYLRRGICCFGVTLMMFMAQMSSVSADECDAWETDSVTENCRTPICDGVRRTAYLTYRRHKTCRDNSTNETYTLTDIYTCEGGCCSKS